MLRVGPGGVGGWESYNENPNRSADKNGSGAEVVRIELGGKSASTHGLIRKLSSSLASSSIFSFSKKRKEERTTPVE